VSACYDARSIQILNPEEAQSRFHYARIDALAARYPGIAPEFIARLVEACDLSGYPLDAAERRYLAGDKTVAITPELREVHRALAERRHRP
jgi:hypothetical protein